MLLNIPTYLRNEKLYNLDISNMKSNILLNVFFALKIVYCRTSAVEYQVNLLYQSDGDLKINFLLEDCSESLPIDSSLGRTLVNSAIWTVERLNQLQTTAPLMLGLSVYQVCNDTDKYNVLFHIFQQQTVVYQLGIVNLKPFKRKLMDFCQTLDIRAKYIGRYWKPMIKASIELLTALSWKENVTILTDYKEVVQEVYKYARREWICIKDVLDSEVRPASLSPTSPTVIFAEGYIIKAILSQLQRLHDEWKIVIIPLDGEAIPDLPEGSFIIQPIYGDVIVEFSEMPKIIPTPLLLDIAHPIISYALEISNFFSHNCNETSGKINCLRSKYKQPVDYYPIYAYHTLVDWLKIEPLTSKFNYNVYRVENVSIVDITKAIRKNFHTLTKVFSYNVFDDNILDIDEVLDVVNSSNSTSGDCSKHLDSCIANCLNFQNPQKVSRIFPPNLYLRSDAWIFAFLSVSILGVIFCLAIIILIFVRLFQKYIFEGNPTLTVLLLIVVIIMYLSIIPFGLDGYDDAKIAILATRSLCISLPYAAAFSLLLSRAILLATISKEVGFMSHVPGTVQSFLTLFMFGVQCALSLQIVRNCEGALEDFFVMYLLSYNVVLLLMLVCVTPLIVRSQRNYKEGRYFTIASILLTISWCAWVPAYVLLGEDWKDPILCMGLVSTASILLGCLFIPRTYMMAVAAARDRFASALPSLATATSAMDIYRASTQPLYDCVNVATVNALNIRNANHQNNVHQQSEQSQQRQRDFYSPATAPENDYEIQSETSTSPDKVTRF